MLFRSVNSVDWNMEGSKLTTAYAIMDFQKQPEMMSLNSYVWDVHNPNEPEYIMKPLSQGVVTKFNLKDPNIVGMGQYNGQFSVFDMRKVLFTQCVQFQSYNHHNSSQNMDNLDDFTLN